MTRTTLSCGGVVDGQQMLHAAGPVQAGPGGFGVGTAPPSQPRRRSSRSRGGRTRSPHARPVRAWPGCPGVVEELEWLLVHDDDGVGRIVGPDVDGEHVLHRRDERCVGARRNRPARLQVRLKCPLFRTRPIVEWSIGGIPSVTATCFSSSRRRPPLTSLGRLGARQRDHPGLDFAGHLGLHRRCGPLLAADHVLDPPAMCRERLRHQVDRALRRADPLGHHPTIRRVTLRLVQRQQHPGPGDHPSRMPTRGHHLDQLRTVTRRQADRELLGTRHDVTPSSQSTDQKSGPRIPVTLEATRH